jgi:hypothetical protein
VRLGGLELLLDEPNDRVHGEDLGDLLDAAVALEL